MSATNKNTDLNNNTLKVGDTVASRLFLGTSIVKAIYELRGSLHADLQLSDPKRHGNILCNIPVDTCLLDGEVAGWGAHE